MMIFWETAEALGINPELSRERIEIVTASGDRESIFDNLAKATLSPNQ